MMQIIFIPDIVMVASFFVVWPVLQVGAALLCKGLSDESLKKIGVLLQTRKFEQNGEIYDKFFYIRKWKKLLPDGAAVTSDGFRKKHMQETSKEYIEKFILETYRAELVHILGIVPFFIFGFYCPFYVVPLMFIYALAVNVPCLMAQRYNRPRLERLLTRSNKKV